MQIQKENHRETPARRAARQHQLVPRRTEPRPIAAPADVYDHEPAIPLGADVPGVPREAISVDLDGTQLTLEGRQDGENGARLRRSFQVPSTVDAGKVAARIDNGVLRVQLPKREDAKPRRIEVRAG